MARVREGDREGFADLVDRHKDAVVNYLARLTGDRDRAEDLAQETFLRLFRSAGDYTEQGYLRAFLFRIATNLVRSEERREKRLRLLLPFLRRRGARRAGGSLGPAAPGAAPGGRRRRWPRCRCATGCRSCSTRSRAGPTWTSPRRSDAGKAP